MGLINSALALAFALLVAHVVCDYPLQGDFLAKAKNHRAPIPGIPWWQALMAHALIQGGGVALVTGSIGLGMAECIAHALIDRQKCAGSVSFNDDQFAHALCKCMWLIIWQYGLPGIFTPLR